FLVCQVGVAGDVGELDREVEGEGPDHCVREVGRGMPGAFVVAAGGAVDQLAAQFNDLRTVGVVRMVAPGGVIGVRHAGVGASKAAYAGGGAGEQLGHVGRAVGALEASPDACDVV